ncbi:MAG: PIG-L family deacetylase [Gemmatimonadetes bacterium]|nr:PIG-L family deacetylase [Gemmatimonadota bacterium]
MRRQVLALLTAGLVATPAFAQLEPPATGGIEALDLDLRRLGHVKRVLVIGAHPDDEDTDLLALLARGQGAQVAYLSLTRGEGGQNLIGDELGAALGLLRTEELLAARRLDGARQFFTRAYDFGYSKSVEETFRLWPREEVLKDVVRVIRRFRPQVVVSIFSAEGRGGHGHHQAAGILAQEAFRAAGDPNRFRDLLEQESLEPYAPLKLLRSARFDAEAATLTLESGLLDPIVGKSYHQIAMASRSRHRSQDQGRLQQPGPSRVVLAPVEDRTGQGGGGLFAGIDTTLAGLAQGEAADRLRRFSAWADSARRALDPRAPGRIVPLLADALRELRPGPAPSSPWWQTVVKEQERIAEAALANAAGIVVDAIAEDERVTSDQPVTVRAVVWNAGSRPVTLHAVTVGTAPPIVSSPPPDFPERMPPGALVERTVRLGGASGGVASQPYFLRQPLTNGLYDWSDVPSPGVRGLPFESSPFTTHIELEVHGERVTIEREATYRYTDQAVGEVRRPVRVVPRLGITIEPKLVVWPLGSRQARAFTVTVTNYGNETVAGELILELPKEWPAIAPVPFRFEREDERRSFTVALASPPRSAPGTYRVAAVARARDGAEYRTGIAAVDYPHIRPRFTLDSAVATVRAAEIALPDLSRVAYVRGAADRVPELLRAVGLPVELLDDETLLRGSLDGYDAIVVGSRAYETNAALASANARLLEYVRRGGLVLVQYQQYQFVERGYAPYPLEIARPHDRVADETAPAELLAPGHPAFHTPNTIGARDWDGWVQERGLYFPREWDERYEPLVAFADPGEAPKRGAVLVARVGQGVYIYTGLSFFRQLPAGVPGAYRLFANLVALGRATGS